MRNQPETLHEYNIPRLNWWFFLASLLFVGCLALMIWVDYSGGIIPGLGLRGDRQWKNYQRQFYALEKQRLAADARAAEVRANEAGLTQITTQLATLGEQVRAKQDELAQLQADVARHQVEAGRITREFTMAKATRDEYRSFYEAALAQHEFQHDHPAVREWKRKVESQNELVDDLQLDKQKADGEVAAAEAAVDAILGQQAELERQKNRLTANQNLLEKRLAELDSALVQTVVNAPVLEFAAATIKVEQIVADDHHVDVNFTTVPRVDRCITCHKGIDRKDPSREELSWRQQHGIEAVEWSRLPQPLRSHPRLDLYVSDTSPHPASTYGCTVCHWGWDRETDFSRAGHTPNAEHQEPYVHDTATGLWGKYTAPAEEDEEEETTPPTVSTVNLTQREAWERNYHWEEQHYLLQPMREKKYIQASCLKCHADQTNLPGGEQLDHGRRLIGQLGCWGCHKMKQLETYSTHVVKEGEDFDSICRLYDVDPAQVRRLNNLAATAADVNLGQELQIPIRTLRKDGPSLYKLGGKDDKTWVRKWLANPVAVRPNTYMPRFWGLSNSTDPDRDAIEINAITEYLFTVSKPAPFPEPPVPGDAARGQELISQVGCLGCHVIDERVTDLKLPKELKPFMDEWAYRRARSQGPQLAGVGSKTTAGWLFAWLKDPKQYHPETKMPNLRLSDQEAVDLAVYLMTLRQPATETATLPDLKPHRLDELTIEYLAVTLPRQEAEAKLHHLDDLIEPYFVDEDLATYYRDAGRMARETAQLAALRTEYEETYDDAVQRQADQLEARLTQAKTRLEEAKRRVAGLSADEKKNVYLGNQLINRYGCYACHNIHGFDSAKPIGTELSEWGSKPVNKLDFGLLSLPHDRIEWLKQKLRDPRSYDKGRIGITRSAQELLKMPKFNLTDDQIDQVVTFVAGMTDEKLTYQEPRQLTPAEFHIERGRWLLKELNCVACHVVEGKGGAIRATGIPAGMEPPLVSGTPTQLRQGQRTQPDWLFRFLKAPVTGEVRPWLKVRMPTFGLSDAEANVLVKYFALEGRTRFPYETPQIDRSPAHLAAGKQLFDQLKCALCHIVEGKALGKPLAEIEEEDLPRLAPNLSIAGERLQREWLIEKWLTEPLAQVPGTRMPQFEYGTAIAPALLGGDSRRQREALVDYLLTLGAAESTLPQTPEPPAPPTE